MHPGFGIEPWIELGADALILALAEKGSEEVAEEPSEEWCEQHGLLGTKACGEVAAHCNDRKQSAKMVQVQFGYPSNLCTLF